MAGEQGDASHGHVGANKGRHDKENDILEEASKDDTADGAGTDNTPVGSAVRDHGGLSDENTDGGASSSSDDSYSDILALDEACADAETDEERAADRCVQYPVRRVIVLGVDDREGTVAEGEGNGQAAEKEYDSVDGVLAEEGERDTAKDERHTDDDLVVGDELLDTGRRDLGAARLGRVLQLDHALLVELFHSEVPHAGLLLVAEQRDFQLLLFVVVGNAFGASDGIGQREAAVGRSLFGAVGLRGDLLSHDLFRVEGSTS